MCKMTTEKEKETMLKMMKPATAAAMAAGMVLLGGCGGGGSSEPTSEAPDVEVAAATAENGVAAVDVIVSGTVAAEEIGGFLPIAAVSDGNAAGFNALRFMTDPEGPVAKLLADDTELLNATLYDEACSGGGSYKVTGTTSDNHMDMTGTFYSCVEGDMTLNGSMHVVAEGSNYGETLSYMQVSFPTTFTMNAGSQLFSVLEGSRMEVEYSHFSEYSMEGRTTSTVQWDAGGMQGRYDGFTVEFTADFSGEPWIDTECYTAGRVYINDLSAYVDIDSGYDPGCTDPFTYVDMDLVSGSTRLIGADGVIDVNVVSDNTIIVTDKYGTTLSYDVY
jgi:hypothetical protein